MIARACQRIVVDTHLVAQCLNLPCAVDSLRRVVLGGRQDVVAGTDAALCLPAGEAHGMRTGVIDIVADDECSHLGSACVCLMQRHRSCEGEHEFVECLKIIEPERMRVEPSVDEREARLSHTPCSWSSCR